MQTETIQRKDEHSKHMSSPKGHAHLVLKEGPGKKMGVPFFLKGVSSTMMPIQRQPMEEEEDLLQPEPESTIQLQPLEEEKELLQPKTEEGSILRQPMEEEEEEPLQPKQDNTLQRQPEEEGEEISAVEGGASKVKVYTVKLSTGTLEDVSAGEAVAFMMNAYNSIRRQIDLAAGHHETLKRSRDQNFWVGVGGFLSDTFMGRDIPPLKIWDKPRNMLALARISLAPKSVEAAGNALKQAQDAYRDATATFQTYLDELEMASGATQIAIGAIPVAFLVIGAAWVAVSSAAAGGAVASGGAAVAEGTAAAETAATAGTAAGGVAVGGGVGGSAATATTVATAETVSGIAVRVGGHLAAGNVAAADAILIRFAATAGGRKALLLAAQSVVYAMQQPGVTRQEFQFLKQLSEMLFNFARGG